MPDEFAFANEVVPGIRWDAKYATWDNFTGKPVDGYVANRILGTRGRALRSAGECTRRDIGEKKKHGAELAAVLSKRRNGSVRELADRCLGERVVVLAPFVT
jgi:D-ala-D-ala dipeptidase